MANQIVARSLSVVSVLVLSLPRTAFVSSAQADIINVPEDYPTIQGAINISSKGDEIVVAPGTYCEQINFLGQAITLRSSAGPGATVIDAEGGTAVTCASGESLDTIMDGFTVTGGGTGMRNFNGSSPTVRNCEFSFNMYAGGMRNEDDSNPDISYCVFRSNVGGLAGGIWNEKSAPAISHCLFIDNQALQGTGAGAVRYSASFGDAIDASITNCLFAQNSGDAGAIKTSVSGSGSINVSIQKSIFVGNAADFRGGAVRLSGGVLSVENCLFANNVSQGYGGAIDISSGVTSIDNSTFVGNVSSDGGGIYGSDEMTIANCIFWLNLPNQIVNSEAEVFYTDIHGGWDGFGEGNINAYPMFVDIDGGNLRLLEGSPCIDTGSNDYVPKDLLVDLDGNERIVDGDEDGTATVDMGAYEYQGYPVCAADMDGDGAVGPFDLAMVLGNWGFNPGHSADLDHDGTVGPFDLALLLGAWGPCE